MPKLLIICSEIHKELAAKQRILCEQYLKSKTNYPYNIVTYALGTKELPMLIKQHEETLPYDGYIVLGLMTDANQHHYNTVMTHVNTFFTHLAMTKGTIIGDGIITGHDAADLQKKLLSHNPCESAYESAVNAVLSLIESKQDLMLAAQAKACQAPAATSTLFNKV